MTRIRFYRKHGLYIGFAAEGHAQYGEHGYDIVCAAISALTQTTASALTRLLGVEATVTQDEARAIYRVHLPAVSRTAARRADDLLSMLSIGLCQLQADYPRHLRVIGAKPHTL